MNETPRLAPLAPDEWDDDQRALLEPMATGEDGEVLNIFATLARHPKLLKRWLVFGNHIMVKSELPARARELVILRTGWRCGSRYEFGQHTVIGRLAGLGDDEITALAGPIDDGGWSDDERVLLAATDQLIDDHVIGDETWAALAARHDEKFLLDLVFTVGQYTLVSMALRTLGVPIDEGFPGFPDEPPETNGSDV
jgi:4-carboxymuconolactone decarboxylase